MNSTAPTLISNYGQIKSLELPDGWKILETVDNHSATPSWLTAGPGEAAPQVEICSYFRGRPLAAGGDQSLKSVLEAPHGQLNAKQIESLENVFRDAVLIDAFRFLNVRTQEWNGRNVLIVEGRWNELQHDRFWIFVPKDRDCFAVQEIWFQAPIELYPKYLKTARQALSSIVWAD